MKLKEADKLAEILKDGMDEADAWKFGLVKRAYKSVAEETQEKYSKMLEVLLDKLEELEAKLNEQKMDDVAAGAKIELKRDEPKEKGLPEIEVKVVSAAVETPKKTKPVPEGKICVICGKAFIPGSNSAKYCDECRREKKKESNRESERKRRERIREGKAEEKETFDAEAITKDVNMAEAFARELAAMEG